MTPSQENPLQADGSRLAPALCEVLLVGGLYIIVTQAFVRSVDLASTMPAGLSDMERTVGGNFLGGAVVQLTLVIGIALFRDDMKRALRGSLRFGNRAAWSVALIAGAIHVTTIASFFIDDTASLFEISTGHAVLSFVPTVDGWSQEVMFRGYVIYRLARSGAPAGLQIAVSAILFSGIHIGYAGEGFWSAMWPLFGTMVLGGFLAWSVRLGNGALMPAIVCHALIIVFVQPWLALAS